MRGSQHRELTRWTLREEDRPGGWEHWIVSCLSDDGEEKKVGDFQLLEMARDFLKAMQEYEAQNASLDVMPISFRTLGVSRDVEGRVIALGAESRSLQGYEVGQIYNAAAADLFVLSIDAERCREYVRLMDAADRRHELDRVRKCGEGAVELFRLALDIDQRGCNVNELVDVLQTAVPAWRGYELPATEGVAP